MPLPPRCRAARSRPPGNRAAGAFLKKKFAKKITRRSRAGCEGTGRSPQAGLAPHGHRLALSAQVSGVIQNEIERLCFTRACASPLVVVDETKAGYYVHATRRSVRPKHDARRRRRTCAMHGRGLPCRGDKAAHQLRCCFDAGSRGTAPILKFDAGGELGR